MLAFFWVLALSVGLGEPASDKLAPYRGRPVVDVRMHAPANENPRELRDLIDIEPGYLLTSDDVQAAIKRLYSLGRFAAVEVHAERRAAAVVLHFFLQPLRRLDKLRIDGTSEADAKALRAACGLQPGDELDSGTNERVQTAALKYLQQAGFAQAQVHVEELDNRSAASGMVELLLRVQEGPPTRIRSLHFAGTPRVAAHLLLREIGSGVGSILDRQVLADDRLRLERSYVRHGYLGVEIKEATVVSEGLQADVTFAVQAGHRVQLIFRGNTLLSDAALRALWPNPSGRLEAGDLSNFIQAILNRYRRLSYHSVRVRPRGLTDSTTGQTAYIFQIDEGEPTRVSEIVFHGATAIAPELLAAQVRATLASNLDDQGFFSPLAPGDTATVWAEAPKTPWPPARRPSVPAEQRWVPEIFAQAISDITAVYVGFGYLQARIEPAVLEPLANGTARVNIAVSEQQQTFVRSISMARNEVFKASALLELVAQATQGQTYSAALKPGAPLSKSAIEEARIALLQHYRNHGYVYARVFADLENDSSSPWADVRFRFEEGPQVRVQRVLVRGYRHTRPRVIRENISLRSGDIFSPEQAMRDQTNLASLGVFSQTRVRLADEEDPAELKDVVAEVAERPRQPVELAPGISTADGPRVRAAYSHLNVFGTAAKFTGSIKLNRQIFFQMFGTYADQLERRYASFRGTEQLTKGVEREVRLGIRSIPIKTLPFSPTFRFDLLNERENAIPYSLDTGAAIAGVDFSFPHRFRLGIEPVLSLTSLECASGTECAENNILQRFRRNKIENGLRWTAKLTPTLSLDRRDNPFSPQRGFLATLKATYAVGGARDPSSNEDRSFKTFAFSKFEGSVTAYAPLGGVVLALSARAGAIRREPGAQQASVPIDERFFLGGRASLRGFIEDALLPQDACAVLTPGGVAPPGCGEPLAVQEDGRGGTTPPISKGGNTFVLLKTELRLPLSTNVSFDIFVDAGNLWSGIPEPGQLKVLRLATGAGLRYSTPVGALSMDLGVNPRPRSYRTSADGPVIYTEPSVQLHFAVGAF